MRIFKKSIAAMLATGLLLFACSPDKVAPTENSSPDAPGLAGAVGDPHPRLDIVCAPEDSILLASEHDGSLNVSKCNIPGGMGPCTTTTPWGGVELYSGFDFVDSIQGNSDDVEYFVANFWTNGGFYIDQSQSDFGVASSFTFDNGVPVVTNDWFSNSLGTLVNKYQDRRRIDEIGSRNFSVALRLTVVKLNLYSQIVNNSTTKLWGYNPDWNDPQSSAYSPTSAYLTPFVAINCAAPAIPTTSVCASVNAASGCGTSCTNLTPNVSNIAGTISYAWSTGETSASLNVCPTVTTPYSVTVSANGSPAEIFAFNVNVVNATTVNFEGMAAGTNVTTQLASKGVATVSATGGINKAWTFNSGSPTGGDFDLGTPNQSFGGPGIGNGGPSNQTALGNLLIIQENTHTPDDNARGGNIYFTFTSPLTVASITMVDIEETGCFVQMTKSNGSVVTVNILPTGDNSVSTTCLNNTTGVVSMRVRMKGSGAIASFNTYGASPCL